MLAWLAAGLAARPACAQPAAVQGTDFTLFWRGDLRIIATRDDTAVSIVDASTGLPLAGGYASNIAGNPFELRNAGDSFEANDGATTLRIHVSSTSSRGPREDKPLIVWTGSLDPALVHPASPPAAWTNAWVSNVPALAPGSVENGTEIGREFWGFTSKEMWIVARKATGVTTSISIEDVASNVEGDTDDTQAIGPSSTALVHQDAEIEAYYLDGFEDDTFHVTSNVDVSLSVGIGSRTSYDWTVTPPSWGAGEDARELGTLFYAFVARDLTVFPTQDSTTITITDLSDGDDSATLVLREGNLVGDYDVFVTDLFARNGTGLTPRAASPAVRLDALGPAAPFENDLVRIEADRPVLVYVGPKSSDTSEYADVAYAVRTGPSTWLSYCYAQNGGAEDFQVFAYDPATNVTITSLTCTTGFRNNGQHDFRIPAVTPWLGGNATTNDWYWASGTWNGELLRVETDGPVTLIDGDYDGPNFGCFIPFVSDSGLLLPIADAGPDQGLCPGRTSVVLDGSASFDADFTPGALAPRWAWDVDPTFDTDGDTIPTNDADYAGPVVTMTLGGTFPPPRGPWTITLTYTDDDGQVDTDVMIVSIGDAQVPVLSCPVAVSAPGDAVTGAAWVDVVASITDECDPSPLVTNDRTAGGADASDTYPCGATDVTFTGRDASGHATTCRATVTVSDVTPPGVDCPSSITVPALTPLGADVTLVATARDACDPDVPLTNDRTTRGADASGFYPCGRTLVTFTATDDAGNAGTCTTAVDVLVALPPVGVSPALRVSKAVGADPHATAWLHWETASARPWQRFEVRRTTTASVRPYPVVLGDPTFAALEWTDVAATGPLLFYQVHVADCAGGQAPDPLALSP